MTPLHALSVVSTTIKSNCILINKAKREQEKEKRREEREKRETREKREKRDESERKKKH